MDFTFNILEDLLTTLRDSGYYFMSVKAFSEINPPRSGKLIVLRHDVDKKPANSLAVAHVESKMRIHGTYYFRIKPESFDTGIIKEIASMGHEIGYHYEDMDLARQKAKGKRRKEKGERRKSGSNREEELAAIAIESFKDNLAKLREIAPIHTICMHGSPLSRYDSRLIWKYYDYQGMGITAEPYFDFSLDDMLYLTDTGRRWDGSAVSIRDRAYARNEQYYSDWVRQPVTGSAMAITEHGKALRKGFGFKNTVDIIGAAKSQELTERVLITFHPQRWSDDYFEWTRELIVQNIKNPIKHLININKHRYLT